MLDFKDTHEVNWRRILITCISWPMVIWICFTFLRTGEIERATYGLVQGTLVYSVLLLIVVVFLAMGLWGGKLRAGDIGLIASKLPIGLIVTFGGWAILQLILFMIAMSQGDHTFSIDTAWMSGRWTWEIGRFTNQIFGAALVEELVFRGYLVPQLYLKFNGKKDYIIWRPLVGAIVVSQLYFALIHIQNLHNLGTPGGSPAGQLAEIFITGAVFALLYIRTANIFVCIGFHALINAPMPLILPMFRPQAIVFILMLVVLVVWPWLSRSKRDKHANVY